MNVQHRTSNIEFQMGKNGEKAIGSGKVEKNIFFLHFSFFSFDVGRSMFDVGRSSFLSFVVHVSLIHYALEDRQRSVIRHRKTKHKLKKVQCDSTGGAP